MVDTPSTMIEGRDVELSKDTWWKLFLRVGLFIYFGIFIFQMTFSVRKERWEHFLVSLQLEKISVRNSRMYAQVCLPRQFVRMKLFLLTSVSTKRWERSVCLGLCTEKCMDKDRHKSEEWLVWVDGMICILLCIPLYCLIPTSTVALTKRNTNKICNINIQSCMYFSNV